MRRREFVTALGIAGLLWPVGLQAQEAGRTYRIGFLSAGPRSAPYWLEVFDDLQQAGFVEGQNLTVDWHQYGSHVDLISQFAAEVVEAKVDVIVATGDTAIRAVQQATTTIPILGSTDDMIGSGLVNSLARPDGNTTGTSIFAAGLDGKRQELLIEAVPGIRHMAALVDSKTTASSRLLSLQQAARSHGVELSVQPVIKSEEIPAALDAAKAAGAAAINVLSSPVLFGARQSIIQRVAVLRLPAIYQFPDVAEEGGFLGYGPRVTQMYKELVGPMLVKLLRGTKPIDLPIEQPTKFELVVNLKTANALALEVPESFLARADKVIE
jgi:putative tryptophan/tyrosine transport system substrate-binding protein